jgi:hypothetical protein
MENELRYFDALKRITKYQTPEQLRKHSMRDYALSYYEALEMAYENVIQEAKNAVLGKRRPKTRCNFGIDSCDGPHGKSGFICNGCAEPTDHP